MKKSPERVQDVIKGEEADFLKTIERGLVHFANAVDYAKNLTSLTGSEGHYKRINGVDVFQLHTTYGFPPDLTKQMADEQGLRVEMGEYEELMREHEAKSRGKKTEAQVALNVSGGLPTTDDHPKWHGPTAEGKVVGWIADNSFHTSGRLPDTEIGLLLDRTSFYAEQGGQVGDTGTVRTPDRTARGDANTEGR